ncbi:MAG TPA: hypothetical protein VK973_03175, partial [Arenicellales bacterium]|nr:hypothetical protein [Arenicellales bacterium]
TNVVEDAATVTISGSTINANGITVTASTQTSYAATAPVTTQTLSGGASVDVVGAKLDAGSGALSIHATDQVELRSETGNAVFDLGTVSGDTADIDALFARNDVDRDVRAAATADSDLDTTDGDIEISAERAVRIFADAGYTALDGDASGVTKIAGGGNFTQNSITGDVEAYLEGSTADTGGSSSSAGRCRGSSIHATRTTCWKPCGAPSKDACRASSMRW